MKHESGIGVCLIPADGDGDSLKYPELQYQQKLKWKQGMLGIKETEAEYNSRHNCCFVRCHENQRFKIVVRFNEGFEMYSSSSIWIGVGIGNSEPYRWEPDDKLYLPGVNQLDRLAREFDDLRFDYHSIQKSFAVGQQTVLESPAGEGYEVPEYKESNNVDYDEFCAYRIEKKPRTDYVNPGTLTVVVQRGGHDWPDGDGMARKDQSKIGPGGPLKERPRNEDTFLHTYSRNGREFRWEFRVRSLDRMREIERRNRAAAGEGPMSCEENNDSLRYTMIRDEDFKLKGKQGEDYRQQLQEEYLKKGERDKKTAGKPLRERKKPKVCECPEDHVDKSCKKRKARDEATGDGNEGQNAPRAKKPKAPRASTQPDEQTDEPSAPSEEPNMPAPGDKEALIAPRACNKCQKYKKPPKGKKWFFVKDIGPSGRDEEAADEDTVQEVVGGEQSQEPPPPPQQPILQRDEDDEEMIGIFENKPAAEEIPPIASTLSASPAPEANEHDNIAPGQVQESGQVNSQIMRDKISPPEVPSTRKLSSPPSPGTTQNKIWSPVRFTLHLFDGNSKAEASKAGNELSAGGIRRSLPQVSGNPRQQSSSPALKVIGRETFLRQSKRWSESSLSGLPTLGRESTLARDSETRSSWPEQRMRRRDFSLSGSQTFGNRSIPQPSPLQQQEPSSHCGSHRSPTPRAATTSRKQQHTTIDLTGDTTAEIKEFKKECSEEIEAKYQHAQVVEDSEDEVEAELRNVRLRCEEIQLERKQAELERKLKQMAAAKCRTKVKQEID
ncbi:hypothetical protein BST61_g1339 [Cercospora zeina]